MRKGRISFLTLFVFFVLFLLAGFSFYHYPLLHSFFLNQSFNSMNKPPLPTITPTPSITADKAISAPDGKIQLIMKTLLHTNGTKTYAFFTADATGNNQQLVFTNDTKAAETMTIPANSWSPDGKYFFIEEDGAGWNDIFVMQASGENFSNGQKFFEIPTLFTAKKNDYTYKEVTGWASQTLLIVNTTKDDQSRGPSFWFVLPYGNFIQLAG